MEFNQEAFDTAMNELSDMFEKNTGMVVLVKGKVQGEDYWAYALIPPANWPAFQYMQTQGGYDLGEYASEIWAQGEGKNPPQDMLKKLKTAHPELDFDFEQKFKTVLEAA